MSINLKTSAKKTCIDKKYFKAYKQTAEKFAWDFKTTEGSTGPCIFLGSAQS